MQQTVYAVSEATSCDFFAKLQLFQAWLRIIIYCLQHSGSMKTTSHDVLSCITRGQGEAEYHDNGRSRYQDAP
ncbi:uncharacterized protein CPUR_06380 [Claviceps purpurea 20.1]|uniref:Uncharacterized protein n=1 Tax=Claviceps purpurea (strain 20.1) TaxID=1111077 RepID=M1W9L8_CLAP2|nr:uncharacterized protein CPUR_06380 [Claviceps purpurea 20.1]